MGNAPLYVHPIMFRMLILYSITMVGCAGSQRGIQGSVASSRRPFEPAWHRIGSFSTTFDIVETTRSHNVRTAAKYLDGATIPPHGSLSFNREVGPRTLERGFQVAPVLMLEGARPALGGGVCQVSSTLYNAALYADLRIIQRSAHSRPIRYVPLGRDATVSWGSKDLVVQNPNPYAVRLSAFTRSGRLLVEVYAPVGLAYEVRLETADYERATPRKKLQLLEQPDRLSVGGVWVKLYRHKVIRGSVVSTERIGRPTYYPFKRREAAQ